MNHDKIVPQAFMLLPREIREHLAPIFGIGRSGITEIRDDQVISDGRTQEDLNAVTAGKMADYVGSEESFGRLWELSIAKAKHELHPPVGEIKALPKVESSTEVEVFEPYKGPDVIEESVTAKSTKNAKAKKSK